MLLNSKCDRPTSLFKIRHFPLIYLFIYGSSGFFTAVSRLSLVAASGSYSLLRLIGSGVQAWQLWCMGLVACGLFPGRDQACIPCIGRWIPNHWTTREVLPTDLKLISYSLLGLPVCPNPPYFPSPFPCPAWLRAPLSDPLGS